MTNQTTQRLTETSWTTDNYGNRYPSVTLGDGISWVAYHSVSPHTVWVDGHLVDDTGTHIVGLDIVATQATREHYDYDDINIDQARLDAQTAWDDGHVHAVTDPVTTLFTPHTRLDGNELAETLTRFQP